jgi:hypothetical protein
MDKIKTPELPEPKFSNDLKNRKNKGKKEREAIKKKVKYLDQLYNKEFLDKYFNEK